VNIDSDLPTLDHELLNSYVQTLGKAVVEQMFTLYSQQSQIYLLNIEESLLSDNTELWREHCHKMKGAAGSVGLKVLHVRLTCMESSSECVNKKAQQLAELRIHNKQVMDDFDYWLSRLS